MKKLFFLAAFVAASVMSFADGPRAVGGRLGYGVDASYQHALGESNMVQLEVGVPFFSRLEAACTYDWINPGGLDIPWNERGDWNWYAGVGGAIQVPFSFTGAFIGAAGRIGVEYNFWFPLQLSIDFRPTLGISCSQAGAAFAYDLYGGALGIGVRYKF